MMERNNIIETIQEWSDVEDHIIVADGIGYGRLYTPIARLVSVLARSFCYIVRKKNKEKQLRSATR